MNIDHLLALDEASFYVKGWLGQESRLTAISPEGERLDLHERLFSYPRDDLEDARGFLCFFRSGEPSLHTGGWRFETENAAGAVTEVAAPPVVGDLEAIREEMLHDTLLQSEELMREHISPAMSIVQERARAATKIESVARQGEPGDPVDVSIVVPVYKRIDHVDKQLAGFAEDPDLRRADLIYVLDSRDDAPAFLRSAPELFERYQVPFRIAVLNRNGGFARATNAGASLARARLLVLLNSDVFPDRPGWLEALRAFYDSKPGIGALGPKLVYADDTIQHAGMYFSLPEGATLWQDAHYFQGLPRTVAGANVPRSVPAVSGACLMISRDLYERFGLREVYVRGDYEDFDLCLRLLGAGYENWYTPDAELYHLEAQSYFGDFRHSADRYNLWLQSHLWRDRIAELMRRDEYRDPADAGES